MLVVEAQEVTAQLAAQGVEVEVELLLALRLQPIQPLQGDPLLPHLPLLLLFLIAVVLVVVRPLLFWEVLQDRRQQLLAH
jgi:hypothetical protein